MIYELNHLGILVRDIEASLDFYGRLDARVVFHETIVGTPVQIAYMQLAGGLVEFIYDPESLTPLPYGADHLAFLSDDLDADYGRLLDAGCLDATPPKPAGTGIGRLGFVLTPDGARLELLQRDLDLRIPEPDDALALFLDHFAYAAASTDDAARLFAGVLGMEPVGESRFRFGADAIELTTPAPSGPRFPHLALRVASIDQAAATLESRGVAVERTPDGARLTDPDGLDILLSA
ncbi:VOC family protein [Sinomonas sp. ASV486]|uniref:VOC family protein n=1 Tax=Sinomonas sp. ASV486 TaxID=3051170 RepID=UPI0027DE86EA|nr:VOC family protein [Sinomonas sp. ASV486]MDQ4489050.1 VOC family protein [Sinomonas sp. ASV486]